MIRYLMYVTLVFLTSSCATLSTTGSSGETSSTKYRLDQVNERLTECKQAPSLSRSQQCIHSCQKAVSATQQAERSGSDNALSFRQRAAITMASLYGASPTSQARQGNIIQGLIDRCEKEHQMVVARQEEFITPQNRSRDMSKFEASIKAADDADSRGFGRMHLIHAGEKMNLYLPRNSGGSRMKIMIVHQVETDEALLGTIPSESDWFEYWCYQEEYIKPIVDILLQNSYVKAQHLERFDFYHYARGIHRADPESSSKELPITHGIIKLPVNLETMRLNPFHTRTGCQTVSEAIASDDKIRQRRNEIKERSRIAEIKAQEEAERLEAELKRKEATHGFLLVGTIPWSLYENGDLLENIFRGHFEKISTHTSRGHAALYYLYLGYVFRFEEKCKDYLPENAVKKQIETIRYEGGYETNRELGDVISIHPELSDAFVHYRTHPGGAGIAMLRDYVSGGLNASLSRSNSWEKDLDTFFAKEKCDNQAMVQLRNNMARLYKKKASIQAGQIQ